MKPNQTDNMSEGVLKRYITMDDLSDTLAGEILSFQPTSSGKWYEDGVSTAILNGELPKDRNDT